MGKWVILVGGTKFGPSTIKAMTFEGKTDTRDYGEKQYDVLFREGYVSFQFDYNEDIKNDYSPECLKSLPFDDPQFILLKYSERSLLVNIISSKDFPEMFSLTVTALISDWSNSLINHDCFS